MSKDMHMKFRAGPSSVRVGASILATGALVLSGGIAHSASATVDPDDETLLELTESSELDTPVIASGELQGYDASNTTPVLLYAWPSADELNALPDGAAVDLGLIGYAEPDETGGFEVRISDYGLADEYRGSDGVVYLEIAAHSDDQFSSYNFVSDLPATASDAGTVSATSASGEADAPLTAEAQDLTLTPVPVDEDAVSAASASDFQATTADDSDIDDAEAVAGCGAVKVGNIGTAWANVGYGYVTRGGAKMKFLYTKGAQSALGVGISSNGSYGSWSASGKSTISTSDEQGYDWAHGKNYLRWQTKFTYGKFLYSCYTNGVPYLTRYQAKAIDWAGGGRTLSLSSAPTATYCVPEGPGDSFTKSNTQAYETSSAVSSSPLLGINLSGKTGYSTGVRLRFEFTKQMQLCGTHGCPGGVAQPPVRLVAK